MNWNLTGFTSLFWFLFLSFILQICDNCTVWTWSKCRQISESLCELGTPCPVEWSWGRAGRGRFRGRLQVPWNQARGREQARADLTLKASGIGCLHRALVGRDGSSISVRPCLESLPRIIFVAALEASLAHNWQHTSMLSAGSAASCLGSNPRGTNY